ncbi:hypothetical protein D3C77_596030 [compost metagenome]
MRHTAGKISEVAAFITAAVATTHQKYVAQFFLYYQVNHGIGSAEQYLAAKTDGDQLFDFAIREASQLLRLSDHSAEIIPFQMVDTRPANDAARPDTIAIVADVRIDDAVGGHDDRAREFGEFGLLILPATAVVTHQVREFFQLWIAMGR